MKRRMNHKGAPEGGGHLETVIRRISQGGGLLIITVVTIIYSHNHPIDDSTMSNESWEKS